MSLAGKRQAFADTLSTVAGVNGHPYRPGAPRAGDAWPQWAGGTVHEESGQIVNGWSVLVYLPQEERAADDWVDARAQLIGDALELAQVAYVDGFAPANLSPTGTVYGLLITTRSE
jgi:hypothetical protein